MPDSLVAPARRARARLAVALILGLALLATATPFPAPALAAAPVPAHGPRPDYSGWQALLDTYAIRIGDGKSTPADIRFDYVQLYVDEGIWTKKRSDRLDAVHAQLFAVAPSAMDERTRLAWAINTCNFLVIERATMHLLVPMRKFLRYEAVEQMATIEGSFFDGRIVEIEGRMWSIAEFERAFVYGDSTPMGEPRARAGDPRLMFALCRGSLGGPSLYPRAFRPESLDAQLDLVTRTTLARPAIARWDAARHSLLVSNLLAQRRVDFGGPVSAIVPFLEKYGPHDLRSAIRHDKVTDVSRFTPVDPTLNQFERPKPQPPTGTPGTKS
jgi:hypothetical protein